MYIFFDESGDVGTSKKSSRHFLLSAVICSKIKPLEKIVTLMRRKLQKKYKNIHELHAYHSSVSARRELLLKLASVPDIQLAVFIFKKISLKNQDSRKNNFYITCARQAVINLLDYYGLDVDSSWEIFFDQRDTKRSVREELIASIKTEISDKHPPKIFVVPSHTNKGVQVADFVSWSIFRKYEYQDTEYYDLIKNLIILEKSF